MTIKTEYNPAFFANIQDGSRGSAREIVPALLSLVHPQSVVDIGCGTGSWLSIFREKGIEDIVGIDGDYVARESLLIPLDRFIAADLREPLSLGRRYDLVLSLEVGEHLPRDCAKTYIHNLISLGDVIAFSAAIPHQGGTGHVNEQWPEYWKALFETQGFAVIDCLRPRFWNNRNVERWYRQNMLLFVHENRLHNDPLLMKEFENYRTSMLSLVHPATFLTPSLKELLRMFPRTVARGVKRRLGKKQSVAVPPVRSQHEPKGGGESGWSSL